MPTRSRIVYLASEAHKKHWSPGGSVSEQTKKSQTTCRVWQDLVLDEFGNRFSRERPLNDDGPCQKIDLLDNWDFIAYELKASQNNVHMEIYRDVFKALVFNQRHPDKPIRTLVFIAPITGIKRLGTTFPKDVQTISRGLNLELILEGI